MSPKYSISSLYLLSSTSKNLTSLFLSMPKLFPLPFILATTSICNFFTWLVPSTCIVSLYQSNYQNKSKHKNKRLWVFSPLFFYWIRLLLYISVFIGRKIMAIWMGDAKVHELYTAACGLYMCWLLLRIATVLYNWIPQGTAVIMKKLKEWAILVSIFCKILYLLIYGFCWIIQKFLKKIYQTNIVSNFSVISNVIGPLLY